MRKAVYLLAVTFLTALLWACSSSGAAPDPVLADILAGPRADARWCRKPAPAPDDGCVRLRVCNIGGSLGRVFNDLNDVHLAHARATGMKAAYTLEDVWNNGRGLVEVRSNELYYIDSLSYSFPYLTPAAAGLLDCIGMRFRDSLQARGGGAYRPKVTSLLRTPGTVRRLRRVNRNATSESAHQYATTFDISYSKFICDDPSATRRTFEDLKNLLAEVVADLRAEGRCVVKHERRQACFHITVTAPAGSELNFSPTSDDSSR